MKEEILINNGVDLESSLSYLGDMDMYNETIKDFSSEALSNLANLESTKANSDWSNYAIYAHSLKASARYLGFKKLFDIAYQHELAGKEADSLVINSTYNDLVTETKHMIDVVGKYLGA